MNPKKSESSIGVLRTVGKGKIMDENAQRSILKLAVAVFTAFVLILVMSPAGAAAFNSSAFQVGESENASRFIVSFESETRSLSGSADFPRRIRDSFYGFDAFNLDCNIDIKQLHGSLYVVETSQSICLSDFRSSLEGIRGFEYMEPDARITLDSSTPNDEHFSNQWYLDAIGANVLWNSSLPESSSSETIAIAIIDTGIDFHHPDLKGIVASGKDFTGTGATASDDHGHGTHVAGITSALANNQIGIAGIASGCDLIPIKVVDSDGVGYYSDLIAGIRYAVDAGANIANISLGGNVYSRSLDEAVSYAMENGMLIVAAAGNNSSSCLSYPAAYDDVISVAALDPGFSLAGFSNYGDGLDICAPGVSIFSTLPNGRYGYMSGTSMAAPQVTGALAMLMKENPDWNRDQLTERLFNSTRDLGSSGYNSTFGWGAIDLEKLFPVPEIIPPDSDDGFPSLDNAGALEWFLAEGYTGFGFETYIMIMNPNADKAVVSVELYSEGGKAAEEILEINALSRTTLFLNNMLPSKEISTVVKSLNGTCVVVQRSMYFNYSNGISGGHTTLGISEKMKEWYFAEGYTGGEFDTYLLLLNPNEKTADVKIELSVEGKGTETISRSLPPFSRTTVLYNEIVKDANIATKIVCDIPIAAERAMYFISESREGGHATAGIGASGKDWYFAEGYTGGDFDEWILIYNPHDSDAEVEARFMKNDGSVVIESFLVKAGSRYTVHVNSISGLENDEVSAHIKVNNGNGIVVERAMYFSHNGIADGAANEGASATSRTWIVPEGYTGAGFESWLLLLNPEETAAEIRIWIIGQEGLVSKSITVGSHSRHTVNLGHLVQGSEAATVIHSLNDVPFVAEGAYYFNRSIGSGGSSSLGYIVHDLP